MLLSSFSRTRILGSLRGTVDRRIEGRPEGIGEEASSFLVRWERVATCDPGRAHFSPAVNWRDSGRSQVCARLVFDVSRWTGKRKACA